MLIRLVRLPVRPSQLETFMLYFNSSMQKIRSFEGCSNLQLLSDTKEKNILFTYSTWDSEIHLEKYLRSELFRTTWAQVKPLFYEKPQAWSLNEDIIVDPANKS